MTADGQPVEGESFPMVCIYTPDGFDLVLRTADAKQFTIDGRSSVLLTVDDLSLAAARKDNPTNHKPQGKAQVTYHYWNVAHGIIREEQTAAQRNVGLFDLNKEVGYMRSTANRLDDLPTDGVDPDALAAIERFVAVQRELVKVASSRTGARLGALVLDIFNAKATTLRAMTDENSLQAARTEDLHTFLRSRRRELGKRYQIEFPPLVPPVMVCLFPYFTEIGYYVQVWNRSGDVLQNVSMRYRTGLNGTLADQPVRDRLDFNPMPASTGFTQIDPAKSSKGWSIGPSDHLTVRYDGGVYTFRADELFRK